MSEGKLTQILRVKAPGSNTFKDTEVELEWLERNLQVGKKVGGRVLDLGKILKWKFAMEQKTPDKFFKKPGESCRTIVLVVPGPKGYEDWSFQPPPADANTWLFWILVSVQKHASHAVTGDELYNPNLRKEQTGGLVALRAKTRFDEKLSKFTAAVERLSKGEGLQPFRSDSKNKSPFMTSPDKGLQFEKTFKPLTKGGSGAAPYVTKQKAKSIVLDQGHIYQPPSEPVVVKMAAATDLGGGTSAGADSLIRETQALAAIGEHLNIVRFIDAVAARDGIYLFLEKGKEDMANWATHEKPNPSRLLSVAYGIFEGLGHMHDRLIFHLDMKPQNVLMFANDVPKLIDFGLTVCRTLEGRSEAEGRWKAPAGTTGYIPQECFRLDIPPPFNDDEFTTYLAKRDAYATGMTLLDGLIGPSLLLKYDPPKNMAAWPTQQGARDKEKWWSQAVKSMIETNKIKDPESWPSFPGLRDDTLGCERALHAPGGPRLVSGGLREDRGTRARPAAHAGQAGEDQPEPQRTARLPAYPRGIVGQHRHHEGPHRLQRAADLSHP